MKFGYTIIYTDDVAESISFFERAFGLRRRFVHESGYGELETGETTLSFASHELGKGNLPDGYIRVDEAKPVGVEIALVTEDVQGGYAKAVDAGAVSLKPPVSKPWGQIVAYVRCPDGTLVEICSPAGA